MSRDEKRRDKDERMRSDDLRKWDKMRQNELTENERKKWSKIWSNESNWVALFYINVHLKPIIMIKIIICESAGRDFQFLELRPDFS